jgi:transcriptional regulator with XRE-family HTH domain
MRSREELINTKSYWLVKIQSELYDNVEKYLIQNGLNKKDFAEKLGVTKGYVSQVLNGDFDHKISKLIELCLAINKVPEINFMNINDYINKDKVSHEYKELEFNLKHLSVNDYKVNNLFDDENLKESILA